MEEEFQVDEVKVAEKPLKVTGMSIRIRILIVSIIPMIAMSLILAFYSVSSIRSGMQEEAMEGLEYSVHAMAAAYEAISNKDYMLQEKGGVGTLYKGGFNVTQNEKFIDSFTGNTDLQVTVFYGDTRYATSLRDQTGERIIGTTAAPEVVQAVVTEGKDYETYSLEINGEDFYAYYIPIKNSDGSIVGMYFAGKPSAGVNETINKKMILIIIIAGVMVLLAAIVSFIAASVISKVISNVQILVGEVALGNLDVHIPDKFQKRRDELGVMTRSLQRLLDALRRVISDIVRSADEVETDAEEMTDMIQNTTSNSNEVTSAVNNIADGAVSQAQDAEKATQNVNDMGNAISEIVEKVDKLTVTSNEIDRARDEAESIIRELSESSDRTIEAVGVIGKQVKLTDESVSRISDAIVMITNIAEETNLLSLNASIEAARAGEAGKGFAVVASEIQKLAEESGKSAETISRIIDNLSKESKNTVEAMNRVQEIIEVQQEKLSETREKFDGVGNGIRDSLLEIEEIGRDTRECDEARRHVTDLIQNLSAVSSENATETKETMASMKELSDYMLQLNEHAADLRRLSEELDDEVHYFSFDRNAASETDDAEQA
ncbi:MAG: methyl-accepting chemotaxis protein [Eubacterium sp.]|nr:methyl-accepting chemotaxis protein [Eubacterium sp.]